MAERAWDRRKTETGRAHVALLDYCAMGPGRSIRGLYALYRQLIGDEGTTQKPPSRRLRTLARWSSDNDWPDRAAAWDVHMRSGEEQKWAEFYDEWRDKERDVAEKLLEKSLAMLLFPVARRLQDGSDGTIVVEPLKWNVRDAARLAEAASKLARLAAGEDTDRRKVTLDRVLGILPADIREAVSEELGRLVREG